MVLDFWFFVIYFFPFFIALATIPDAEPFAAAATVETPPVFAAKTAVFALPVIFAAALFILVIEPAPPAVTMVSAIVGVIRTPMPVTM